jgi:putative sterol carrier protein
MARLISGTLDGSMTMSVADIEAALTPRLAAFSELDATLKVDFGSDTIFIDGTQTPATLTHEDKDANCTIAISAENMAALLHGTLDPTMAYMTGKLKVTGNTGIAMKLAHILKEQG